MRLIRPPSNAGKAAPVGGKPPQELVGGRLMIDKLRTEGTCLGFVTGLSYWRVHGGQTSGSTAGTCLQPRRENYRVVYPISQVFLRARQSPIRSGRRMRAGSTDRIGSAGQASVRDARVGGTGDYELGCEWTRSSELAYGGCQVYG